MTKGNARRDPEEDVELGEEVEAKRKPGTALVAVRVPSELLERVQLYARGRGLTVSDALRLGAEQLVAGSSTTTYSLTVRTGLEFAPQDVPVGEHVGWATPDPSIQVAS